MWTTLQILIRKDLRASVKVAAAKLGISMKDFVSEALEEKLKLEKEKQNG